jgi:hypothetical protein
MKKVSVDYRSAVEAIINDPKKKRGTIRNFIKERGMAPSDFRFVEFIEMAVKALSAEIKKEDDWDIMLDKVVFFREKGFDYPQREDEIREVKKWFSQQKKKDIPYFNRTIAVMIASKLSPQFLKFVS